MPQIPRYESNVNTAAMPGARQNARLPDNPIPSAIAGLGKAMGIGADVIGKIAEKEAEKEINTEVMKKKDAALQFEMDITKELAAAEGDKAKGIEEVIAKKTKDFHNAQIQALPESARPLYHRWATPRVAGIRLQAVRQELAERDKMETASYTALLNTINSTVAADPTRADDAIAEATDAIMVRAGSKGWSKQVTEDEVRKASSNVRRIQINSLVDKDPKQAEQLFAAFKEKGQLDEQDITALAHKVTNAADRQHGVEIGDKLYQTHMAGKTVNDAPPLDKMLSDINADETLTPQRKHFAELQIKDNVSRYKEQKRLNEEGVSNYVAGLINDRKSFADIMGYINGSGVDDYKKLALKDYAETHLGIKEARAEARADARMEAKERRNIRYQAALFDKMTAYMEGRLPDVKTPADASKYIGEMGPMASNFAKFIFDANSDLANPKQTTDDLKQRLRVMRQTPAFKNAGLPDPDSSSEDEKAKLAMLMQDVLGTMSGAGKKGPTGAISVQKALEMSIRKGNAGETWYGGKKEKPLYTFKSWSPEEQTSYVKDLLKQRGITNPTKAQIDNALSLANR